MTAELQDRMAAQQQLMADRQAAAAAVDPNDPTGMIASTLGRQQAEQAQRDLARQTAKSPNQRRVEQEAMQSLQQARFARPQTGGEVQRSFGERPGPPARSFQPAPSVGYLGSVVEGMGIADAWRAFPTRPASEAEAKLYLNYLADMSSMTLPTYNQGSNAPSGMYEGRGILAQTGWGTAAKQLGTELNPVDMMNTQEKADAIRKARLMGVDENIMLKKAAKKVGSRIARSKVKTNY